MRPVRHPENPNARLMLSALLLDAGRKAEAEGLARALVKDGYRYAPDLMYLQWTTANRTEPDAGQDTATFRGLFRPHYNSAYGEYVRTVSGGRFDECPECQTEVRVGGMLVEASKGIVTYPQFAETAERMDAALSSRFLSVDPLTASYPHLTPYQFASNTPIYAVDLDGLEANGSTTQQGRATIPVLAVPQPCSACTTSTPLHDGSGNARYGYRPPKPQVYTITQGETTWMQDVKEYIDSPSEPSTFGDVGKGALSMLYDATNSVYVTGQQFMGPLKPETVRNMDGSIPSATQKQEAAVGTMTLILTSWFTRSTMAGVATQGAAAAEAQAAASSGGNIALGVREHLQQFAKQVGGTTWETWGAGENFPTQFLDVINNTANKIHFNLDNIANPWAAVSEGARGYGVSRVTSWELHQIYSNPSALSRTTFYRAGKAVPNPFE